MQIKKSVLSVLALGTTISAAQAQTEAGKLLLTGRVNYSQSTSESNQVGTTPSLNGITYQQNKQTGFGFLPQIGFFVADKLAIGLSGGISSSQTKEKYTNSSSNITPSYSYTNKYETKAVSVGPFVRYYHMIGEKVGFYGQLAGGYQRREQESGTTSTGVNTPNDYSYGVKSTGGFANLTPGFVFFPTQKLGLELTVGNLSYSRMKGNPQGRNPNQADYENTSTVFGADFGLQYLTAGVSFHLGN